MSEIDHYKKSVSKLRASYILIHYYSNIHYLTSDIKLPDKIHNDEISEKSIKISTELESTHANISVCIITPFCNDIS